MLWAIALFAAVQDVPVVHPPAAAGLSDVEFCTQMRRVTESVMAELPKMVDPITRTDGMSVLCSLRTVTTNKFFLVKLSDFREGWEARKQEQWNRLVCDDRDYGPMARKGWRFTLNLTFLSGERFIEDAKC